MIHYRQATQSDIPMLVQLRTEFLKEVTNTEAPADFAEILSSYFTSHLSESNYVNWLALDGDKIVGTGGICFYQIPPNFLNVTGDRGYIVNMFTTPSHRRRGISKAIFEQLMQAAALRGVPQVSLHATATGRGLYEQFGFQAKDSEMVWGRHL